jgi:hypothetical protein
MITIAAPGPSLWHARPQFVDIAINYAIRYVDADWLASNDQWGPLSRLPSVGVLTRTENIEYWRMNLPTLRIVDACKYAGGLYFSSESAIYHAIEMARIRGYTLIKCYGMDMAGHSYCDGSRISFDGVWFRTNNESETIEKRWKLEHQAVSIAVGFAKSLGIKVELPCMS